jgi:hypothetical protein
MTARTYLGGEMESTGPAGVTLLMHVIGAAAEEHMLRERLAEAHVRVRVEPTDAPASAIGLELAEGRTRVVDARSPCDVVVRLTDATLARILGGHGHLAMEIVAGEVTYEGPIRRLLRVLPILRRVAASLEPATACSAEPAAAGGVA